jgi:glycerophosphoryl diester phosphodiesterase
MSRRPLVIGHRGACALGPENTAAALRAAAAAGADMVEVDVQLTKDGRLVVFHDDRVDRTTDGRGRVAALRYAQLARLDAGGWFHPRFAGQRPLLVSAMDAILPSRMRINLELKRTRRRTALVRRVLALVRRHRWQRRVLLSSFDARLLPVLVRRGLSCALISRGAARASLARAGRLGCRAWHPWYGDVTPALVRRAHAAGLRVHAWTVPDAAAARRLRRWGVDGLVADDPRWLRRVLR